ncbi:class I adenylate cyclase [Planctobacterium marinum]|uniref:class I adenylate cyclase n=1 Tax=Planctobacterium marinum TaxID=1631968 RepID=UPI00226D3448|nr:class I adenylate cyclase [Planctobacterium marinum]
MVNVQQNLKIRLKSVLKYNKLRTDRAIALLPESKQPLFHVLPFLLHINHKNFPGFIETENVPYGLTNFNFKDKLKEALLTLFPESREVIEQVRDIWPKKRAIDSILLMGSIGSIGQSAKSDFDYWVCIDGARFSAREKKLLQQKLILVEQWADEVHDIEVHFFLSEIEMVKNNDFGEASGESAGSAQAVFLKSEFYATNIMIAGKVPFWWLVPESTTDVQYGKLWGILQAGSEPDPKWFMDLGNVERLVKAEIFGAAIWQISKAMDSPFKSVLKMAKLEVFLENIEQERPLCNILKKRVHFFERFSDDPRLVDPYAMMFDQLIEYYSKAGREDVVELLKKCLYIKSECKLSEPTLAREVNFKRQIIEGYVTRWNWNSPRLQHLDNLKHWDFSEVSSLGQQIHNFLIGCYRRLSAKIQQQEQLVKIEDSTVIGRKLDSFYTKKEGKIVYLKRAFDEGLLLSDITIRSELDLSSPGKKRWTVYRGEIHHWDDKDIESCFLKESNDPMDLVLWCVFNRIIDARTNILVTRNCEPITAESLLQFVTQLQEMFPPIRISDIPRNKLLAPARIIKCLTVINFESWPNIAEVQTVRTAYQTSWGELYSVAGFEALEDLRRDLFHTRRKPEIYVKTHESPHKSRIFEEFKERTQMDFDNLL